ncbi:chemotaxis protein CheD [Natronomonas sp. LN261]|uniref:chemotaxis protein CheD n=1 Tax=Natronomonas sp. LN261 TaxID=2750669 RepID=UPI00351A9CD1
MARLPGSEGDDGGGSESRRTGGNRGESGGRSGRESRGGDGSRGRDGDRIRGRGQNRDGSENANGSGKRIKVSIAEFAVASAGTLTTSGLGSCLGIAVYDPDAGLSSLLHPMLPSRNGDDDRPPARFVDSGIDAVVDALCEAGARESALRAKVTGGAAVVDFGDDDGASIGDRNIAAAREVFDEYGVDLVGEEVGGGCGRTMRVDAATGAVTVERTDGVDTML